MITIGNEGATALAQLAVQQIIASSQTDVNTGETVSPVLSLVNYKPSKYLAMQGELWYDPKTQLDRALHCAKDDHDGFIVSAHGVATILFSVTTLRDFLTTRQIQAAVLAALHPAELQIVQTIAPIATGLDELKALVPVVTGDPTEHDCEPMQIERDHLAADLSMYGEPAIGHRSTFFRGVVNPVTSGGPIACPAWAELFKS